MISLKQYKVSEDPTFRIGDQVTEDDAGGHDESYDWDIEGARTGVRTVEDSDVKSRGEDSANGDEGQLSKQKTQQGIGQLSNEDEHCR